jgi:hypothetical protein
MPQDVLLAKWEAQFQLLYQTAKALGIERKRYDGSRAIALAFCEMLILCPTLDSASKCMQADREGAAAFLGQASEVDYVIREGKTVLPPQPPEPSVPFYMICAAAIDVLKKIRKKYPLEFDSQ